ncbi:IS701 family transposase [Spongiactinospora sp. TRM90649]|uniref:IS701 family transposase n=1 Tax=Spongiactinospora sp. TRM90649 TaxID=3031114 RepID=UPI0023F9EA6F|nr:IS701 family transposase [Spongiactinospora sp. TRM90649]MDF5754611.1 IS701 family transposase [Spongiactinospora sp. TRM90649]
MAAARWPPPADAARSRSTRHPSDQSAPHPRFYQPPGRPVAGAHLDPNLKQLLDRRLYLPERSWLADPGRCHAAGVPAQTTFATKPALAAEMVADALDAGLAARWVSGDEVYGQDPRLRAMLERRRIGYVLAIAGNLRVGLEGIDRDVADIATGVADRHWHRYRAGQGAKGPRWYAWAWARIDDPGPEADDEGEGHGYRWLLIRRNLTTGELAFYGCYAPKPMPLAALVKIADIRWAVEEVFQAAKGQAGLDHYQVRRWRAWYRHVTLAMLALAFLAALAADQPPCDERHIPLTMPEIRRLLAALVLSPRRSTAEVLRWSSWRRRHQATARHCHYQRRSQP